MRFVPKLKKLHFIYKVKLKIRSIKYFFRDLIFLIHNNTSFYHVINFMKNSLMNKKHNILVNNFFLQSIFFYNDWFISKSNIFIKNFEKENNEKGKIRNILEIGSFEGRSAIFFLNYFNNSQLTCVDTWEGSHEHNDISMNKVEENFDNNLKKYFNRFSKHKANSNLFFKTCNKKFNLIFIDGNHHYKQVMADAENSLKYIEKGGYILFDDFTFKFSGYKKSENAINAINDFLHNNKERIEVVYVYHQVLIKVTK